LQERSQSAGTRSTIGLHWARSSAPCPSVVLLTNELWYERARLRQDLRQQSTTIVLSIDRAFS
jgi:hypothetical protein